MSYQDKLQDLRNASEAWEEAVQGVQDALGELSSLDPDDIPEGLQEELGLLCDGGFAGFYSRACELEPDLNPPQELKEMAETLADAAENYEDD